MCKDLHSDSADSARSVYTLHLLCNWHFPRQSLPYLPEHPSAPFCSSCTVYLEIYLPTPPNPYIFYKFSSRSSQTHRLYEMRVFSTCFLACATRYPRPKPSLVSLLLPVASFISSTVWLRAWRRAASQLCLAQMVLEKVVSQTGTQCFTVFRAQFVERWFSTVFLYISYQLLFRTILSKMSV